MCCTALPTYKKIAAANVIYEHEAAVTPLKTISYDFTILA